MRINARGSFRLWVVFGCLFVVAVGIATYGDIRDEFQLRSVADAPSASNPPDRLVASGKPIDANRNPITSNLERGVRDRINKERADRKLNPLGLDAQLSRIARAHSEDMARRHFFSHVNPDGNNPTTRGRHAGYECHKQFGRVIRDGLAENLFQGRTYKRVRINGGHKLYDWNTPDDLIGEAIRGWMTSPGHRRNILERGYDRSGIGVSVSGNAVYITQLFC